MEKEWLKEPDRVEWWEGEYHCLIRRHPEMKHLCGYVGVPDNHPLYGKHFTELNKINVHGGLTFSNYWDDEYNLWYLGFDCGHFMDLAPGLEEQLEEIRRNNLELRRLHKRLLEICMGSWNTYRNIKYVTGEVKQLLKQLRASLIRLVS